MRKAFCFTKMHLHIENFSLTESFQLVYGFNNHFFNIFLCLLFTEDFTAQRKVIHLWVSRFLGTNNRSAWGITHLVSQQIIEFLLLSYTVLGMGGVSLWICIHLPTLTTLLVPNYHHISPDLLLEHPTGFPRFFSFPFPV